MAWYASLLVTLLSAAAAVLGQCPPFSGSFFIEQQDLYPESADWSPETCKLYLRYVSPSELLTTDPTLTISL